MIVEQISTSFGLSAKFIVKLAKGASHEYKQYLVPKRRGGYRVIYHPSRRLKGLQRWLLTNIIENWTLHEAAMAYRHSRSIFDNASLHANSRYLLRMDFENFFPSISESDLRTYISERPALFAGWNAVDIEIFCRLVCRDKALTIGAPTSPALSNAVCYEMDSQLHALCVKNGVTYSRYADDLFFSTPCKDVLAPMEEEVKALVSRLKLPGNLIVNSSKTRHSSKRGARRVTGIILGSDGLPHVGRHMKRIIRSRIYRYDSLDNQSKASLAGMIAYVAGFDPNFVNSLVNKYGLSALRKAKTFIAT